MTYFNNYRSILTESCEIFPNFYNACKTETLCF